MLQLQLVEFENILQFSSRIVLTLLGISFLVTLDVACNGFSANVCWL